MTDKPVRKTHDKTNSYSKNSLADKENLIRYLDYEIELIRGEIQQPGWTKWAVSGSLAAVGWLLLNELDKGGFLLNAILLWLIVISLAVDVVSMFSSLINATANLFGSEKNRFFIVNQLAGSSRLLILFYNLRFVSMIVFFIILGLSVSRFVSSAFYLFYGYLSLVYMTILLLSFFRMPLPVPNNFNREARSQKVFTWILFVAGVFSIVGVFQTIPVPFGALVEFRVASLMAIVYYLLCLIIRVGNTSPLMASLIDIRRRVVFDRVDFEFAKDQAEIAVMGLKFSHVLQEYVSDLMKLYEDLNNEIQVAALQLSVVDKMSRNVKRSFSDEDIEVVKSLLSSIGLRVDEVQKITFRKIPVAYSSLTRRLDFVRKISDVDINEVKNIYEAVSLAQQKAKESFYKLHVKVGKVKKTFEKRFLPLDTSRSPS